MVPLSRIPSRACGREGGTGLPTLEASLVRLSRRRHCCEQGLAQLAGISVDYVTRLEQGRAPRPSGQVVETLAPALRLTGDERAYLFALAGLAVPGPEVLPSYIPPSVLRLLDGLVATPVAVTDAA